MSWHRLYGLLGYPLLLAWSPVLLYQVLFRRKYRTGLGQRFGFLPASVARDLGQGDWVWVHAVSVGEIEAASPLLEGLRDALPGYRILLSTTTDTGWDHARSRDVDQVIRFPLDLPGCADRVFRRVQPAMVIILETEIWPNFLRSCRERRVPVVIANGRISDGSYPGYRRMRRPLRSFLQDVSLFLMQTPEDARRIRDVGAPDDRVQVVGNLKFDRVIQAMDGLSPETIRQDLGLPRGVPLLVAGSTHPPEGSWMLEMLPGMLQKHPELVLLLVPRHLDGLPALEKRADELSLPWIHRSRLPDGAVPVEGRAFGPRVILMDRMGELGRSYAAACCAFVGRSLGPTRGGQNVLEPAAWGCPVLFGPHTQNFRAAVSLLERAGCGLRVTDRKDLADQILRLLDDPERAQELGRQARQVVESNRGATRRVLETLMGLLRDRKGETGPA